MFEERCEKDMMNIRFDEQQCFFKEMAKHNKA